MRPGAGLPRAGRWLRRLAPVALLATGACATRGDVRLVRQDIQVLQRDVTSRTDSSLRAQNAAAARQLETMAVVIDSLRTLSTRLTRLQGDLQTRLFAIDQQLIQVQELTGQSQRRLTELRASLEERGTAGAPDAGGQGNPGPNQLLVLAKNQMATAPGAARQAFQDLIAQNPPADVAADAQYWIGRAYLAEGDTAQAVTAYQATVSRFPRAAQAASALYGQGLVALAQGKSAQARTLLQRVVSQYPSSDEAVLARDRLKTIR